MKHTLRTLAFVLLTYATSFAQSFVTFSVNMSGQAVSPNGVHIAGNWQSEAGYPSDWDPSTCEMSEIGDGIYTFSAFIPEGIYEFKFINGNDWPFVENVPAACQVGGGNDNRFIIVNQPEILSIPVFFGQANAGEGENVFIMARFTVDLTGTPIDPAGVFIAGDFMGEIAPAGTYSDWQIGILRMYDIVDDNEDKFTAIYYFLSTDAGNYQYKYLNGNFYENLPGSCSSGIGNRELAVSATPSVNQNCFSSCTANCVVVPTYNVTINVDMRYRCDFDVNSTDSVDVAGTFNNYQGGPEYLLSDTDNDGIYSITLPLQAGEIQYKARIITNGNFAGGWEAGNNTVFALNSDLELSPRCFGQSSGTCTPIPDPAEITFRVEFLNETPASEVYVMGDFTNPPYQGGALLMIQVSDNVFELTTEICPGSINYKFVNGITSNPNNIESYPGIADLSCLIDNGIGGYNRFYVRQSAEPVVLSYVYNTCATEVITSIAAQSDAKFQVYPNPATNQLFIRSGSLDVSQIQLIDLTGKILLMEQNSVKLDCSSISSGYYVVRFQLSDGSVHAQGIVIE
jgi:hypothetical protein